MSDTNREKPDHEALFGIATGQHGYFTAAQARSCGFGWDLLTRHTRSGRFIRIRRGLYRLRDFPSSLHEEIVAAWLAVGKDVAVVSHESALELHNLSDVIPHAIHLTVPRSKRNLPNLPHTKIHTTTRQFRPNDIVIRDGMRVTSPARTILDAAEAGTAPEQIEMATSQAVERGWLDERDIREEVRNRGRRVAKLLDVALSMRTM